MIKKIYSFFMHKWIKKECPHICLLCKYKDTCNYDWKLINSKYLEGYDTGYKSGYQDCEIAYKKLVKNAYEEGYADGRYITRKEKGV